MKIARMEKFKKPFPYVTADLGDNALLQKIAEEWPAPDDGWHKEAGKAASKWSRESLTASARVLVDEIIYSNLVGASLDIPGLFHDPDFFGAGLHCIRRGGFLKMHVDFNAHPKGWRRRANCLVYLNREWRPEWKGQLQLGLADDAVRIDPIGGRIVIFENTDKSWHGHPEKLECPEDVERRSLAIYFYDNGKIKGEPRTTLYRRH